jgi:hypothetical protein
MGVFFPLDVRASGEWEEALRELERVQCQHEHARREHRVELSTEDRKHWGWRLRNRYALYVRDEAPREILDALSAEMHR